MGNIFLGFGKTILGILLFSILSVNSYGQTCGDLFGEIYTLKVYGAKKHKEIPSSNHLEKLTEKLRLKIVNWNLLDFKIQIEELEKGTLAYSKSQLRPGTHLHSKSIEEILEYQKVFQELNADIYVFQEAIGRSLKYFNQHYLKNKYEVILEPSKKETELQIAFLVRKNLDIQYEVQSYRELMWRNNLASPPKDMPVFHKDLPALYLRQKDNTSVTPIEDPQLIIFGTHFKSMRDSQGDPKSIHQRTVQVQTAARIIQDVDQSYNRSVPIMLTGDFNADVTGAREMEPLRFFLKDSMQLLNGNLALQDKFTHVFSPKKNQIIKTQLDGQLINQKLSQKLVEAYVYRFKEPKRSIKIYSHNTAHKIDFHEEAVLRNPSDHRPVVGIYDMTK